jgi:16S rRNA (uracil1498-N3)-methyltransferase
MGGIVRGEITQLDSRKVSIRILSRTTQHDTGTGLTLLQAMLKGKKMDFLIQKATELGVHTFVPLTTRYCEKQTRTDRQSARWQRIMLAACKQCGRPIPMQIAPPALLEQLPPADGSNRIMPWEDESSRPFSPGLLEDNRPTLLLIGPEGGFHPDEVSLARASGFNTISLGPRILRAETAALAAVSIIQYHNHNLEPEAS